MSIVCSVSKVLYILKAMKDRVSNYEAFPSVQRFVSISNTVKPPIKDPLIRERHLNKGLL